MKKCLKFFLLTITFFSFTELFCEETKLFEGRSKWKVIVYKNAISGTVSFCNNKNLIRNNEKSSKLHYKLSDKTTYNVVDFTRAIKKNDFSKMKKITIWVYGNGNKNIYLQLGLRCSDNGYFIADFGFVNWKGWKKFEFDKSKFTFVGNFPDWEDIESLFIRVNGEISASKGKIKKFQEGEIYIDGIYITE